MYLQAYECEQKQGTKTSSSLPYSPDIINTNKPIATKKVERKFTKNPLYPITHYTSLKNFPLHIEPFSLRSLQFKFHKPFVRH